MRDRNEFAERAAVEDAEDAEDVRNLFDRRNERGGRET